jgi:hypothetical protein
MKHIQLHKQPHCKRQTAFSIVVGFGMPYIDISIVSYILYIVK